MNCIYHIFILQGYFYDFLWLFKSFSSPTTTEDKKWNATARLFGAKLSFDPVFGNVAKLSGAPNYILVGDFKSKSAPLLRRLLCHVKKTFDFDRVCK